MTAEDDSNKSSSTTQHTSQDGNGVTTTTTTTTTIIEDEPERLDFDFDPNKQLMKALEDQRNEERECIQKLIDENVRLEKEKKLLLEDAQEYKAKYIALQIDLESVKKNASNTKRIQETEVVQTNAKSYEPNATNMAEYEAKVRDLQFRLKRLAEDDREKDKVIEMYMAENKQMKDYIDELEKHVGEAKVEEIRQKMAENKDKDDKEDENENVIDRSQIVRQGHARSAVCSIM